MVPYAVAVCNGSLSCNAICAQAVAQQLPTSCVCAGWIPGKTDAKALWGLLTGSWLNLLLIVVPIGWVVHFCHLNAVLVFVLVRPEILLHCSWWTCAYKRHASCLLLLIMAYVCL